MVERFEPEADADWDAQHTKFGVNLLSTRCRRALPVRGRRAFPAVCRTQIISGLDSGAPGVEGGKLPFTAMGTQALSWKVDECGDMRPDAGRLKGFSISSGGAKLVDN